MSDFLPHQERVIDEMQNLEEKISALARFFNTKTYENLPDDEAFRLRIQSTFMEGYLRVLIQRVRAFKSNQIGNL